MRWNKDLRVADCGILFVAAIQKSDCLVHSSERVHGRCNCGQAQRQAEGQVRQVEEPDSQHAAKACNAAS